MNKPNQPLDFWNYPDWLGDNRDNPRADGFEPFWMRGCRVPVKQKIQREGCYVEVFTSDRGDPSAIPIRMVVYRDGKY